jgi:hypothetical protein
MSFPIETAVEQGVLDRSRPKLMDWLVGVASPLENRIHARPAYQLAVKHGKEIESKQ